MAGVWGAGASRAREVGVPLLADTARRTPGRCPGCGIHEGGSGGLSPTLPQALPLRVTLAPCSGEARGNMAPIWQYAPAECQAPWTAHLQLHFTQEGVR